MKFLIDMNLSPRWVEAFTAAGLNATHWIAIGDPCATDRSIMEWARSNGYIVFTHDLDFWGHSCGDAGKRAERDPNSG